MPLALEVKKNTKLENYYRGVLRILVSPSLGDLLLFSEKEVSKKSARYHSPFGYPALTKIQWDRCGTRLRLKQSSLKTSH
jgi:hypothetical protein